MKNKTTTIIGEITKLIRSLVTTDCDVDKTSEEIARLKEELISLERSVDKRAQVIEETFNKMAASSERIDQNLRNIDYHEKETESIMSKWHHN